MRKKVFSIFVSLALIITMLPLSTVTANAASTPGRVKNLTGYCDDSLGLNLKWSKVSGASGYQIYLNGKYEVSVSGTKTTIDGWGSYGTTAVVKVRAFKKVKQYYHKTKNKWVSKRPAWKYVKKERTKKYFGPFSKVSIYVTDGDDESAGKYAEHPEITLKYGNAVIHLGQEWTENLHSQLTAGSSGEEVVIRKNFDKTDDEVKKNINQTVYMIDTGDYDNFIAIYVSQGKIVEWVRNSGILGKNGNITFKFGDTVYPKRSVVWWKNYVVKGWSEEDKQDGMVRPDLPEGAALLAGMHLTDEDNYYFGGSAIENSKAKRYLRSAADIKVEKRIMLHYMNAIRRVKGTSPLKYDEDIDGTGKSFTGTMEGETYTNQVYGAQPWADTMYANNQCEHTAMTSVYKGTGEPMRNGPLGLDNGNKEDAVTCLELIIKRKLGLNSFHENVGQSPTGFGEINVCKYHTSPGHYNVMLSSEFTHTGFGIAGQFHCEEFEGNL